MPDHTPSCLRDKPKPYATSTLRNIASTRLAGVDYWLAILTMVATNVKAETMSLMDKRTAVEAEMNAIIARLTQPGAPGLSGNLVDSEVFLFFLSFSLSISLNLLSQ